MSEERTPVDGVAIGVMVLLTALWGFQQVTVKWIAADVPVVMQAALRSIIAAVLLTGRARRGPALRRRIRVHLRGPGAYQRLAHVGLHLSRATAHRA
jgi:drug/metabolite transporter (DMT)-like permease